ncbi:MAG: VWA domain-containing protein [Clostridiales bacterium]|nr:VWA domain-containing protein [Clostridiales bacterium]
MSVKRIGLWAVAATALALSFFSAPLAAAEGEPVAFEQSARHVAVVYDDSGSMYYDPATRKPLERWIQANYTLQTFLALLSERDELYVTYMSDPDALPVNLMEGDRAAAMESIRGWQGFVSNTPFGAVEAACAHLLTLERPAQDEYWLVIMTDGDFIGFTGDLTERFTGMIRDMAARNKTLKVVFFAIGEDVSCPVSDPANGFLVYRTDEEGIVSTMADLSDVISARQRVSEENLAASGVSEMTCSARIPLRSMVVYVQGSAQPLVSATGPDGQTLQLTTAAGIEAPGPFRLDNGIELTSDSSLSGSVTHITSADGMLPPGGYTLTFADDLDSIRCRVLLEPAIGLRLRYLSGGSEIAFPRSGEFVDIEAVLVDGEGNLFDPALLDGALSCRLQELRDGVVTRSVDGFRLNNVRMTDSRVSVVWEASMEGYFTVRGRMNYEAPPPGVTQAPTAEPTGAPSDPPPLTLKITSSHQSGSIPLTRLEEAEAVITPTLDGEPLDAEQAARGELTVECLYPIEYTVEYDPARMGYVLSLRYYSGNPLITSVGQVQMLLRYVSGDGRTAGQTLTFTIADMSVFARYGGQILIPLLLLTLAAVLSGMLFLRRRFPRENAWIEYRQQQRTSSGQWVLSMTPSRIELAPIVKWRMVPFTAERVNAAGLIIKAGRTPQTVLVSKKSLKPGMGDQNGPLTESALRRDYTLHSGVEFIALHGDTRQVFRLVAPKTTLISKAQERKRIRKQKSRLGVVIKRGNPPGPKG